MYTPAEHERLESSLEFNLFESSIDKGHTPRRTLTFPRRGPDGDASNERDAVVPLLPHPAATGGSGAAAQSDTQRTAWRREVAPAMVAAARVSARLVSASGPVAAPHARRGLRRGLSGGGLPRRDVMPGGSGAAAAAAARDQLRSGGSTRNEPGGDFEEGKGEEDHSSAAHGSAGLSFGDGVPGAAASVMEADDSGAVESSSQGSSDSEGDASANREWVGLENPLTSCDYCTNIFNLAAFKLARLHTKQKGMSSISKNSRTPLLSALVLGLQQWWSPTPRKKSGGPWRALAIRSPSSCCSCSTSW